MHDSRSDVSCISFDEGLVFTERKNYLFPLFHWILLRLGMVPFPYSGHFAAWWKTAVPQKWCRTPESTWCRIPPVQTLAYTSQVVFSSLQGSSCMGYISDGGRNVSRVDSNMHFWWNLELLVKSQWMWHHLEIFIICLLAGTVSYTTGFFRT